MKKIKFILLIWCCLATVFCVAQVDSEQKGYGVYKAYDQSFITPNFRGKHSISFGVVVNSFGPNLVDQDVNGGVHLGYNYLVLERRKLKNKRKDKYRNETKFGLGLHVNVLTRQEFNVMAVFYRPLIQTKGRLTSWQFLSEYGIGFYRSSNILNVGNPVKFNLSFELFRIRFGGSPFHLFSTFNYSIKNDFLGKDRLNVGFMAGFRYYIFKNKP